MPYLKYGWGQVRIVVGAHEILYGWPYKEYLNLVQASKDDPGTSQQQDPASDNEEKISEEHEKGGIDTADELLQLKATSTFTEPEEVAGPGLLGAPASKKRKRMKINPETSTGSRIVFGEDGAGIDPLAAMASGDRSWYCS